VDFSLQHFLFQVRVMISWNFNNLLPRQSLRNFDHVLSGLLDDPLDDTGLLDDALDYARLLDNSLHTFHYTRLLDNSFDDARLLHALDYTRLLHNSLHDARLLYDSLHTALWRGYLLYDLVCSNLWHLTCNFTLDANWPLHNPLDCLCLKPFDWHGDYDFLCYHLLPAHLDRLYLWNKLHTFFGQD